MSGYTVASLIVSGVTIILNGLMVIDYVRRRRRRSR